MTSQPDPSDPSRALLPDKALAALNLIAGGLILLIVFAVSALTLLSLAGGSGSGMSGVALGGAFAFVFAALFFSLLILAPLGWLLYSTGLRLWKGEPQARKFAEIAAWILALGAFLLFLFVLYQLV